MEKKDLKYFEKSILDKIEYKWLDITKKAAFNKIDSFVLFLGYPRSSHSLIGAILDAHPNAVVSHELDVVPYLTNESIELNKIFAWIYQTSVKFKRKKCNWTGYNYLIKDGYQGTYKDKIQVIGDKKGGATSLYLSRDASIIDLLTQRLKGYNIKFIHVIRNPFDNITTMARGGNNRNLDVVRENLESSIQEYFSMVNVVQSLKVKEGIEIYDLYNDKLISNPKKELKNLVTFLGLVPEENYLESCASIIFKKKKNTFQKEMWPEDLFIQVNNNLKNIPFLAKYSF